MGADIDLRMGRVEAERDMRDRCKVTRSVTSDVLDEDTGTYPVVEMTVYEGKCRLKQPRMSAKEIDAAGQLLVSTSLELQVPVDTDDFAAGDIAEMVKSPDRPRQVGRQFKVVGPFDGSQTTKLRYRVEAFDER